MPRRIAKIAQEYAHRQVEVGDPFEVEPQDVKTLLAIGRIEPEEGETGYIAKEMTPSSGGNYQTREMTKRQYHRKASPQ